MSPKVFYTLFLVYLGDGQKLRERCSDTWGARIVYSCSNGFGVTLNVPSASVSSAEAKISKLLLVPNIMMRSDPLSLSKRIKCSPLCSLYEAGISKSERLSGCGDGATTSFRSFVLFT